ncbi:MAG TPA: hypothetical protein VFG54_03930 [Prolixibacteraceae bacterium]|nr:hypothetical protein [Prolixibacteraceae bacterium]
MKKYVLLIMIICSSIHLFGQINKGDVMISLNGNFMKTISGSGVTTNENSTQSEYLNVGTSVEYFLTSRLAVGAGLDYQWAKETTSNMINLKLPDLEFRHYEVMETTSNVFLPNVFLKHYIPITQKLYFNTNLKFSYGKIKSELLAEIIDRNRRPSEGGLTEGLPTYMSGVSKKSALDSFTAQLGPELTYFITPKFVGCLALGGVEYSMLDWKTTNSIWNVNFNPAYWQLGVKINI